MIDVALKFLVDEMNGYLQRRVGSSFGPSFGKLVLGPVVDDKGNWAVPENTLRLTVFQIEEERSARIQVPQRITVDGRDVSLPPPLAVNLVVLISARFTSYDEGLRLLSLVLTGLQARPLFTPADNPAMPPGLDRLAIELINYNPEQTNQMWACFGAKHLPSVVYRLRMLLLQDLEPLASGAPITEIHTRAGHK